MRVLLKSVTIIDSTSSFHKKQVDIFIENGIIQSIEKQIVPKDDIEIIEANDCYVSIGWFDMQAQFRDPGLEHKEDLESGCAAAAAGGFTHVLVQPNTEPVIDNKGIINYISKGNRSRLVQLYCQAAVTLKTEGKDFSDMIDLHQAGALAFGDGEKPIYNSDISLKSLQYLQKINGVFISKPVDKYLSMFGQMHEGKFSTLMGTKAIPSMAEEIAIIRDLKLQEYAGGHLHFSNISTKEGVALIRKAKSEGKTVTCDIAANQIHFTDQDLLQFDTNLKVNPPYREKNDNEALLEGLTDGTIDAIVSAHSPHDEESKKLEFDLADFGSSNIQTTFSVLAEHLDIETIVNKIAISPRKILNQKIPQIKVGETACLTVFDPKEKWTLNAQSNLSKSVFSPFWKETLTGKVKAVINNGFIEKF